MGVKFYYKERNQRLVEGKAKAATGCFVLLVLQGSMLLTADTTDNDSLTPAQHQDLSVLLQQFQMLFVEPTQLPPKRKYDQRFLL